MPISEVEYGSGVGKNMKFEQKIKDHKFILPTKFKDRKCTLSTKLLFEIREMKHKLTIAC